MAGGGVALFSGAASETIFENAQDDAARIARITVLATWEHRQHVRIFGGYIGVSDCKIELLVAPNVSAWFAGNVRYHFLPTKVSSSGPGG
ncbi:hypothetical protein QIS74_12651 [Colletotrichum tabaci]|uniref:Uncharacterized protein n=1 Tax=Colletotrichum tabaci TaxID=1209068 RepID=A0AAV9SWB9_9PEZI